MSVSGRFSKRHGFHEITEAPITVRNDAPYELRGVIVDIAYEFGFTPKSLRELVCRVLRSRPDQDNWSEYPNIDNELRRLLDDCEWFYVYDVLEAIARQVPRLSREKTEQEFHDEVNLYFMRHGIGWKLINGLLAYRGDEGIEQILSNAVATQKITQHQTAANELHEAIKDMSRRPNSDTTGVIQHAMASLECVARDVSGSKDTLGAWLKKNQSIFPQPVNIAVEKLWGYASENGRHLTESQNPSIEEAELVLGLSATLGSYLAKKHQSMT